MLCSMLCAKTADVCVCVRERENIPLDVRQTLHVWVEAFLSL